MAQFKTPKFQTKIHLPEIAGSFTFRKNGKCRLDQQVKKFCLLNKSRGCFEVKVHFGRHINPNKIKYDAKQNGIEIDTLDDQQKYKLFVPYPKGLKLLIPSDPEAQFFCGVLSAKLAIISYDKTIVLKKKDAKKSGPMDDDQNQNEKTDKLKKKNSQKQRRNKQRTRKRKKLSLDELNKRIANNTGDNDEGIKPPKKKIKWNKKKDKKQKKKEVVNIHSNEMSVNAQHELIDGLVNTIEYNIKEQRKLAENKDSDIKEYFQRRAEKKKEKERKKKELRDKFFARRMAKKNFKKNERKSFKKSTGKKVTFSL